MPKHPKRKPAFDSGQMAFTFDPLPPASAGSLAGLHRRISSAVSLILREDGRTRSHLAAGVTDLMDEELTLSSLDAFCAESQDSHNISFGRMLALVAETGRYDVLNSLLGQVGARLVVGEEVLTVELGHIETEIQRLQERRNTLRRVAPPIATGGGRK